MGLDENVGEAGHLASGGGLGDWDPGAALWLPGVDYLTAWRAAAAAADALNDVFDAHGFSSGDARAVAVSLADGSATVDVRLSVAGARMVSGALRRVSGRAA
ncbi:hypothetical protein ACIRL2_01480 [Embleya sp. NPDC127516]|uniref:hypothetical protein n=1 Tax=Embleya sp. NPDC127516 TaxID=3363990 RepID=UPI0038064AF8